MTTCALSGVPSRAEPGPDRGPQLLVSWPRCPLSRWRVCVCRAWLRCLPQPWAQVLGNRGPSPGSLPCPGGLGGPRACSWPCLFWGMWWGLWGLRGLCWNRRQRQSGEDKQCPFPPGPPERRCSCAPGPGLPDLRSRLSAVHPSCPRPHLSRLECHPASPPTPPQTQFRPCLLGALPRPCPVPPPGGVEGLWLPLWFEPNSEGTGSLQRHPPSGRVLGAVPRGHLTAAGSGSGLGAGES